MGANANCGIQLIADIIGVISSPKIEKYPKIIANNIPITLPDSNPKIASVKVIEACFANSPLVNEFC